MGSSVGRRGRCLPFRILRRRRRLFDGLTKDVDEAVFLIIVYPSDVVDGCCTAAGFGEYEEGGVGYEFEDHVASVVADSFISVGVEIIHQHVAFF